MADKKITSANVDRELIFPFNGKIAKLVQIMQTKNRDDVHVMELANQIRVATDVDHTIIIQKVGPFLLKFKDQIKNANVDYFLHGDDFIPEDDAKESKKVDPYHLVHLVQNNWDSFKDKEKEYIIKEVQAMFKLYIRYVIYEKESGK